jgi:hypothetical protein
MLIHVKIVCRIIVPHNQLDEAHGIAWSVHSAFGVVNVNAGNPLLHNLFQHYHSEQGARQLSGFYCQTERAYRG